MRNLLRIMNLGVKSEDAHTVEMMICVLIELLNEVKDTFLQGHVWEWV